MSKREERPDMPSDAEVLDTASLLRRLNECLDLDPETAWTPTDLKNQAYATWMRRRLDHMSAEVHEMLRDGLDLHVAADPAMAARIKTLARYIEIVLGERPKSAIQNETQS